MDASSNPLISRCPANSSRVDAYLGRRRSISVSCDSQASALRRPPPRRHPALPPPLRAPSPPSTCLGLPRPRRPLHLPRTQRRQHQRRRHPQRRRQRPQRRRRRLQPRHPEPPPQRQGLAQPFSPRRAPHPTAMRGAVRAVRCPRTTGAAGPASCSGAVAAARCPARLQRRGLRREPADPDGLTSKAASGGPGAGGGVQVPSEIRGKNVEEIIAGWTAELEDRSRAFMRHAAEIAAWDRSIMANRRHVHPPSPPPPPHFPARASASTFTLPLFWGSVHRGAAAERGGRPVPPRASPGGPCAWICAMLARGHRLPRRPH